MSNRIVTGIIENGEPNAKGDIIDPAGIDLSHFKQGRVEFFHGDGKVKELKGYHAEPEIRVSPGGKHHLLSISLCKNK